MTSFVPLLAHENTIDTIAAKALEEFPVPGVAIAVVKDGQTIFCKGYGKRDVERGLPVTADTIFPIASNTKAFTSFLLAKLVEEGKVNWDDPVRKYIPEFRLYTEELSELVTLRDLIAHRTGIPRHDVLCYLVKDLSEEEVLEALPHFPPLYKLRESYLYNNFMYVVASLVIKKITNNTWEEELSQRILKPLGMVHSDSSLGAWQEQKNRSEPYAEIGGKIQKLPFLYPCSTLAASAVHSSVSDMAKWVQLQLLEGNEEMHSIHMPFAAASPMDPPAGYGLGWEIDSYLGKKRVHHGGTLEGFFSEVSLLPEERLGLVILTNSSTDGRFAISYIENSIFAYLLGKENGEVLQKIQEKRQAVKQSLSVSSMQKYEGSYSHPAYGTMQITAQHGTLLATLGKMKITLHEKAEGIFEATYAELLAYGINPIVEFSFVTNSEGGVDELHVPFEHFRSAPPIIFRKYPGPGTDLL